jgi:hypothetical protein
MSFLIALLDSRNALVRSLGLILASLWLTPAFAQTQVQGWHTRLEEAQRIARETGKPIFLVFRCVR